MGRRPLGLGAYLALTRGGSADVPRLPVADRPVVWLHLSQGVMPGPWLSFCTRLLSSRPGLTLAVSGEIGTDLDRFAVIGADKLTLPGETPPEIARFLGELMPSLAIWAGNDLHPALMHATMRAGCRMVALDLRDTAYRVPVLRWLGDQAALVLDDCSDLVAVDRQALMRLRRMGLRHPRMSARGFLPDNPVPPSYSAEDLAEANALLSGRTAWLAAQVAPEELQVVLRAHRLASRFAHRLVLVLVPTPDVTARQLDQALKDSGLRARSGMLDQPPDPQAQVLICDDTEMLGLWYRVAPISFLGSSLTTGRGGINPSDAATLGSAILYGPNVGRHMEHYSRYAAAGAARLVRDPDGLASAVTTVLAPDEAAAMAQAAWGLVTQRADLTDWLIETVADTLDGMEDS